MNNAPFMLRPAGKDYIWGGSRLNEDFNKKIEISPLAETWECSTHPDGQSIVSNTGEKLGDLLKRHPEYLGTHAGTIAGGALPILIKLIDAQQNLSVQVHPDDEYAQKNENSLGKTEVWYVLDADSGSELIYGFNQDMNKDCICKALKDGSIMKYLNHVSVRKNDVFYIEAGTVHAIGAGSLIAEIQESSNITYRLYDYNRLGKDGRKRELHIDKALDVANLHSSSTPRQPMRVLKYKKGIAYELLSRCKYFQVERMLLNAEESNRVSYSTGSNSFHSLLCVDGHGLISWSKDGINFRKGDCIFIPADSEPLFLTGHAQILDISC